MKIHLALAMGAALMSWVLPATGAPEAFRVRALGVQFKGPAELHVHDAAGKSTAGTLHPKSYLNHEFEPLQTKGGALVLSTKSDPSSAKVAEDVVGECELPGKPGSYILLLLPGENANRSKVVVVDAGAAAFPVGTFKVLNTTSYPLKIDVQGKIFEFKAGDSGLIKDPPVSENQTSAVKVTYEKDGKWETLSSAVWPHPGPKRVLQIFSEDPSTKMLRVSGVKDIAKP